LDVFKKVNGLDLAGRWFVSSSLKEETENIDLIDAEEFVKYCCNIRMVKKEDINNPLSYSVVVGEGVAAFGPFYVIGCGKGLIYCFNNLFLHLNANSHHLRVLSPGTDTFCGQYTCYSINGNYYFGYNTMNRVGYVDNLEVPFFAISDEEYAYFTSFYIGKWDMTLTQYDENFQKGETSTLKFNFKKKAFHGFQGKIVGSNSNNSYKLMGTIFKNYIAISSYPNLVALLWVYQNDDKKILKGIYCTKSGNAWKDGHIEGIKK